MVQGRDRSALAIMLIITAAVVKNQLCFGSRANLSALGQELLLESFRIFFKAEKDELFCAYAAMILKDISEQYMEVPRSTQQRSSRNRRISSNISSSRCMSLPYGVSPETFMLIGRMVPNLTTVRRHVNCDFSIQPKGDHRTPPNSIFTWILAFINMHAHRSFIFGSNDIRVSQYTPRAGFQRRLGECLRKL